MSNEEIKSAEDLKRVYPEFMAQAARETFEKVSATVRAKAEARRAEEERFEKKPKPKTEEELRIFLKELVLLRDLKLDQSKTVEVSETEIVQTFIEAIAWALGEPWSGGFEIEKKVKDVLAEEFRKAYGLLVTLGVKNTHEIGDRINKLTSDRN